MYELPICDDIMTINSILEYIHDLQCISTVLNLCLIDIE